MTCGRGRRLLEGHSLGWVVAREDGSLVGFVNVLWDGLVHAWIQDTMVADLGTPPGRRHPAHRDRP